MIKNKRILYKPRSKRRLSLLLFAASILFFILILEKSRSENAPSVESDTQLQTQFNASSLKLDTPDGLPQLQNRTTTIPAGDKTSPSLSGISESSVTAVELKLLLNRLPIQGITIKADEEDSSDSGPDVPIKNETKYNPDLSALLKAGPSLSLSGNGPQVLIYHTHTSEAYAPSGENSYTPDDNDRTLDKRYSVVRVGDEIEKVLKQKGIGVIHYTDGYFDYPSYTGSYTRSLAAVAEQLKKYPSIKVAIDVHRDAMITSAGVKYKTVANINGKSAAQMMIVCGTDSSGLPHKNWRQNLAFDVSLQQNLTKKYPSLMRPIELCAERYNQHVLSCATLIEIGTCGNTLEEAVYSASLFGDTLADTLKKYQK